MANETMTLISTVTVGSGGASSIAFSSIPATYTDLQILLSGRTANTSAPSDGPYVLVRINSSTTGYSDRLLMGSGSSVLSQSFTTNDALLLKSMVNPGNATANVFSSTQIYIPNYAGSSNKSISSDGVNENNATNAYQTIQASLWSNSAAINSITLSLYDGTFPNWAQYSTASLYGILKGSGGATVS